MILLIDNYDSFTYNLVQRLGEIDPTLELEVHRNDQITLDEIAAKKPTHLIISPGPCTPSEAGISCAAVERFAGKLPILGVCLGHQSIGQATGGKIVRAKRLMHGKTDWIHHDNQGLVRRARKSAASHALSQPGDSARHAASRLHRLRLERCPDGSREIMAIRHKHYPLFGLQFHPESFLTLSGTKLLERFLETGATAPLRA